MSWISSPRKRKEADLAEWFAPRRFGIGTGRPISWQGWVLSVAYGLVALVATLILQTSLLAFFGLFVPATLGFIIVSARTTRGGWRWRWGKDD